MKCKNSALMLLLLIGFLFIVWLIYHFFVHTTVLLQGEIEANRTDISARIQGRAAKINYDVGDNIKTGDILVILRSPELLAQQNYVQTQLDVAIANKNVVYSTRPENIEAQKAALGKAESDLVLAQESFNRIKKLTQQNYASKQMYDDALNKLQTATKARNMAQANYDLAVNGNSVEAKRLADTQVEQAQAALEQINIDVEQLTVVSPIDGQVTAKVAELGQLYNPGTPLFTLIDLNNMWITFNIREDFLNNAKVGDTINVCIPALKKTIKVKITTINALGAYANWRATKATGGFDLKTFEVRVKPIETITGLRPGMTALTDWHTD